MAVAIDNLVKSDETSKGINTFQYYMLNPIGKRVDDVDPNDVVLSQMIRLGLRVGVPRDVLGKERFPSKSVDGHLLQKFIDEQYSQDPEKHKLMTKFRVVREYNFREGKSFDSFHDAMNYWLGEGHLFEFEMKYHKESSPHFKKFVPVIHPVIPLVIPT